MFTGAPVLVPERLGTTAKSPCARDTCCSNVRPLPLSTKSQRNQARRRHRLLITAPATLGLAPCETCLGTHVGNKSPTVWNRNEWSHSRPRSPLPARAPEQCHARPTCSPLSNRVSPTEGPVPDAPSPDSARSSPLVSALRHSSKAQPEGILCQETQHVQECLKQNRKSFIMKPNK